MFYQQNILVLCAILEALTSGTAETNVNIAEWGGVATSLGQKLAAASVPVVLASDQSALSVAVTSVIPGVGATNLGKAESAAHTSGDVGIEVLGVAQDPAAITTFSAAGQYTPQAVLTNGATVAVIDSRFQPATTTGLLHLESSTHVSADAGVLALVVRNTGNAVFAGDGAYSPVGTGTFGNVLATLRYDQNISTSVTPIRVEDDALAQSDPGLVILAQRQDVPISNTTTDGDAGFFKTNSLGYQYVDPTVRKTFTHTQPTITTATSFTLLAANTARTYMLVQNNSAANIMINLNNGTLTGIVPTSTNLGIVLAPNQSYESPPNACPVAAITVYQTSGGNINTVSVVEA